MRFFHRAHPTPMRPADVAGQPQRLIILHTNDLHGRLEGIARVATVVERIRAEHGDYGGQVRLWDIQSGRVIGT